MELEYPSLGFISVHSYSKWLPYLSSYALAYKLTHSKKKKSDSFFSVTINYPVNGHVKMYVLDL